MKKRFSHLSLEWVNKSWAIFDTKKLDWVNSVYIKEMSKQDFKIKLESYICKPFLDLLNSDDIVYDKILKLSQERLKKFSDINEQFIWLYEPKNPSPEMFPHTKMKVTEQSAKEAINDLIPYLENIEKNKWNEEGLKNSLISFIESKGQKNAYFLWPLRVALTREAFTPWAFEVMDILWKGESVKRVWEAAACF